MKLSDLNIITESNTAFELMWKKSNEKKFKRVVEVKSLTALIKMTSEHKTQLAVDNQISINNIELIIVKNKIVHWFDTGFSDKQIKNNPDLLNKFNKDVKFNKFTISKSI